jgi:hypothetical protein
MTDTAMPPRSSDPLTSGRGRKGGPKLLPRFVLRLDETTYDVLREYAHREHVPMNVVVREAVRAYLKDHL